MKSLQQITFDFTAAEEPVVQEAPVVVKEVEVAAPVVPGKRGRGRPRKDPTLIIRKEPGKRGRKSLKDAAASADLIDIPDDDTLFSKQYYSIGEVAGMFKVTISLLRMWEKEFDILEPKKNKKGDRFFRPVDIKNLELIHFLLRQRKYTIEGAKEYLRKNKKEADVKFEMRQSLQKIRSFLLEVKANL